MLNQWIYKRMKTIDEARVNPPDEEEEEEEEAEEEDEEEEDPAIVMKYVSQLTDLSQSEPLWQR